MSDHGKREENDVRPTWYSEPVLRVTKRLPAPRIIGPIQIAERAVQDIRDNIRRNLLTQYSSDSEPEFIETEREVPFGELDLSLFRGTGRTPRVHRGQHRVRLNIDQVNQPNLPGNSINDALDMARNIDADTIDAEIDALRTQLAPGPSTSRNAHSPEVGEAANRDELLLQIISQIRHQMCHLSEQIHTRSEGRRHSVERIHDSANPNVTYGRTANDVRNRQSRANTYMQLKEARALIPEFDGTSQNRLQEFLNASTYAMNNISPAEEPILLEAILCTKLKGKAMIDFDTRDIQSFEQLKRELEICYSTRKSLTHLQLEFNSLKQKMGESAQEYGLRTDKLAMELYQTMTNDGRHSIEKKHTILEIIQKQALQNYQIGLRDNLKTIVRSRDYNTLHEAISNASSEEKIQGPSTNPNGQSGNRWTRSRENPPRCTKCNRMGHYRHECRETEYASRHHFPKPTGKSHVNTSEKYCNYCKKTGHAISECWKLHGRPKTSDRSTTGRREKPPYANTTPAIRPGSRPTRQTTDSTYKDQESVNRREIPARDLQFNHISKWQPRMGLEMILMPMREANYKKIPLLFDSGAIISFIKLRNIKEETLVTQDRIILASATGHPMYTLGKFTAHIQLRKKTLQQEFYVVKNDCPIDYEGVLGIDFLKTQGVKCDFGRNEIRVAGEKLTLIPKTMYRLPARSETIIQATTNTNTIGIINATELKPGVILGNCLVEPHNHLCSISVINNTEETIDIDAPHVDIEELEDQSNAEPAPINAENSIPIPRAEQVKGLLRTQHLNPEERKVIEQICEEFNDIFYLAKDPLTYTNYVQHRLTIPADTKPVNIRPYRLPHKHNAEINAQVDEMVKNKIIRPSCSQWNAPIIAVPKKPDATGKPKLRIVVDFRKLNDLTIGDSFPLPNITDILDQLGNAKYFTTLDLASGYHQIPMAEEDKDKTAFSTPHGHYEFNRMPFGLKNAPATFQRLMNTILTGLQGIECLVYLDDIVIYGASLEEHNKRLKTVLQRLRQNNLKLQPEKCEFLRKEVTYLGHIISEHGIFPDPKKLEAVSKYPTPKKVKDIQAFIGLAGYYRRFIDNFSKIARPLTNLTKKGIPFAWETEQQHAFNTLKEKLTAAPVLKYPDFSKEFVITTDASDYAIGAILSQGNVGQDNPIAYASRVLSRTEQNYNTTEKELLAIVWAVKHFRPYVYGTKFKIVTDHKPLVWLFNINDPGSRLIRWRLKLEEYDYEVIHKAGRANINADALSRYPALTILTGKSEKPMKEDHNQEDTEDETNDTREYTEEEKKQILYEYHDAPLGGHQGVQRTLNRIRQVHNWKGITTDVTRHVSQCVQCQKNKMSKKTKIPLVITDTPSRPFEKCALDIVGPLPVTNQGNKYVLTFQDSLTKFSKAIPIPNQEANTIAREFVHKVIFEHGIPRNVLTDQGTNFLSEIFKNTCKLLRINKIQTTAYHPESNGALERSHRTLAEYLRHFINADQTNWDEWTAYAMFTYNTTPHTATNFTPFELVYGYKADLPTALTVPPKATYSYDDYTTELREKLRTTNQMAKENLKEEKAKSKKYYDQKTKGTIFRKGDKVLLYDETVRRGRSKKLDAMWTGPYEIITNHDNTNYTIKKGRKTLRTHANRLKLYIEH